MQRSRRRTHFKDNILNAGGLSCRPMNTIDKSSCWNICGIDDEIADLPVEKCRSDPVRVLGVIRVCINESQTLRIGEASRSFDYRDVIRIPDQLREVCRVDRTGNHVGTGGEIDHCWRRC